jgi:predicted permease
VILRAGVSIEAFAARIDTLVARANAEAATPSPYGGTATRAQQMFGTRLREALTTLAVAVGLMLLIACLNASALLVNRADRRRHETAVRVALGAGRGRIIRQHLIESLLLATAAGLAGVTLAAVGLQLVQVLRPDDLSLLDRASLDGPVIAFSLALTALTGLVFGLLPAWQAASRRALDALRRGRRGGQGDRAAQKARWGLVVAEVALSFTLLVGGGLLVRTMIAFNRFDVGYRPESVLVAHVTLPAWSFPEGADRAAAWERVLEVSRGITGVESVTLASGVPPRSGVYFGDLEVEGREIAEDERRLPFFGNAVGPTYFSVLDQRVVAGRSFTDDEAREGAPVYVVSESTARALWPDGEVAAAVGRRMRIGEGDWRTVIGVVSDVPATGLTSDRSTRQLYTPHAGEAGSANVVVRVAGDARDTRAVIPALVERLRIVAPEAPIEINEAVALLGESVAMQRFTARLLTLLAALAALLASAGMYGVVAETVGRRTQEIGIRISLGAHGGAVVWMVLKAGSLALALGVTLGVGLSLASARVIESQLFGVEPGDLPTFIAAGLTLSVAVLVATWLPARRAARIDPVRAMAAE